MRIVDVDVERQTERTPYDRSQTNLVERGSGANRDPDKVLRKGGSLGELDTYTTLA